MTIVSGASDGIRANSAAKESVGAAATLGSQTAAASDEIIVPDAITSNNEGNLETSPVYIGRMIAIRPWEMKLVAATLQAAGDSYLANDVLTLNGVAGPGGGPQITVDTVGGSGEILTFSITREASVEIRRGGMTSASSPADNPVGHSGGTGTGATFDCIWANHFEIRFITADTANTLTVHEAWDVPPVSGDNWAVSYILEDYATTNGLTLRAQSGVFEATRRIKIGPSADGTRRGWLAMNDGKSIELDNVTDNTLEIANGGILTIGYTQGGVSVNGAYISTSGTAGPDFDINVNEGSLFFMHDIQIRSPREALSWAPATVSQITASEAKWRQEVECIARFGKLFDVNSVFNAAAHRLRDLTIQLGGSGATFGIEVLLDNGEDGSSIANINRIVVIGFTDSANSGGFHSLRTTFTEGVVYNFLRNITFLGAIRMIEIEENETWEFINPVYVPILIDQINFDFNSTTGSSIVEKMSLIIRPVTAGGDLISGVHGYIFEGGLNDDQPTDNTEKSDSAAYVPRDDLRFEDEIDVGAIAYFADVVNAIYTPNSTTDVIAGHRDMMAWRGYDYGNVPVTLALTINLIGGIDNQAVFLIDNAITETDQATAISNPTSDPTVIKHGPGESDTRPMKALAYDAGTGSVPTLGETVTQGSATGVVVEFDGSATVGTLLLDEWNGTEFADNQNITGGTSSFDATTDVATFYEEYTWEVNGQGEAMTIIYDYLAARMAEDPITAEFDPIITWGGDESTANQLLFLGTNGFFTNRAVRRWTGKLDPAATRDFSDNFDRSDEDLSASGNWNDVDNATNDMRILTNELGGDNDAATTNVGEVDTSAHTFANDQYAEAIIDVLPTGGDLIGVACRIDTTRELCYAGIIREGTPDTYEIVLVDFSTSAGVITTLATGASTPATTDVMRLVVADNTIILLINDVEETRYVDNQLARLPLTSGQAGVMAEGDASPAGRLDEFGSGDYIDGVIIGEGVWVHDRGVGTLDFLTSDSGTTFTPQTTVTVEVIGLTEGAACKIIANETVGSIVVGDVILEDLADANGEASVQFLYEAAFNPSGLDVIVRTRQQGLPNAAIAEAPTSAFTDETTAANSSTTNDVNLLPVSPAGSDAYYFGHSEQFPRIKIDITDVNGTGSTITWEYWTGSVWVALSGVVDGTDNYENIGENIISWTIPGDWAKTTVNSQGPFFYVRGRLTTVGSANQTRARKTSLDITRFRPFFQNRIIETTGLSTVATWIEDTISIF